MYNKHKDANNESIFSKDVNNTTLKYVYEKTYIVLLHARQVQGFQKYLFKEISS